MIPENARKIPQEHVWKINNEGIKDIRIKKYLVEIFTWCDNPVYTSHPRLHRPLPNVVYPIDQEGICTQIEVDVLPPISTRQTWWYVEMRLSPHNANPMYGVRFRSKWADNEYLCLWTIFDNRIKSPHNYLLTYTLIQTDNIQRTLPESSSIEELAATVYLVDEGVKAAPLFINHHNIKVREKAKKMLEYPY